jgi:carboxymethylenebutenolidase
MNARESGIEIRCADGAAIGAFRVEPPGSAAGAVVVIQEVFGVNPHIREVCRRIAAAGYVALAPALFDRLEPGVELGYDEAGIARGRELVARLGFDTPIADIGSAAGSLRAVGRVGTIGFCWGGTAAWLCATRLALPSVSYYGARTRPFLEERAQAPILMHFGQHDHLIAPEFYADLARLHPSVPVHFYPAGHGFNCEARADYEPESAALAWQRTLAFFARELART